MEHKEEKTLKKHPWPLLLFSIIFFAVILYWIMSFPPAYIIPLGTLKISLLIPFFIILFLSIYASVAYITISSLQGLLLASAALMYLLMRYFGISHPLFGALLLAIVVSLEFALLKKK